MLKYYLTAYITLLSAVLGFLFSIQAVRKSESNNKLNALYMLARSLAVVFMAAIPICTKTSEFLAIITVAMLIIQLVDGFAGIYIKNPMRTIGPFTMAFLHAVCLLTLI